MTTPKKLYEITDQPLSLDDVAARVSRPNCGAITTFGGIVRGETVTTEGPRSTDFLAYEAYTEMAEQMRSFMNDLEIVMIPDCGHWTQQEAPDATTGLIIDWLATL